MPLVQRPYTFFGNTPAIADEVNANFDVLFNLVNGQIDGANLAPVTINDSLKPTSQTASVWLVLSWLANRLAAITGQPRWSDDPPTTIKKLQEHVNNTSNPHKVTAQQIGAVTVEEFNNHHHDSRYTRARNGARNIWVQTSAPSGASDGDIWIRA